MLVKCVEMQAGGASIKHLAALVECMFHADAVQLARIARGFQAMRQLARYFKPGKLAQLRSRVSEVTGIIPGIMGISTPARRAASTNPE